ncbi:MAG: hypothetical protein FWC03_04100 [Treponema sp.]|nr:hypothetical protein [Treponema sp.]
MNIGDSVYSEKSSYAFFKSIFTPSLRSAMKKCVSLIFYNFFYCQHRAAFLPGKIPVTKADHPLDDKIPFVPAWVTIYLDFIQFWIRMLSFLLRRYRRRVFAHVRDFIFSMGRLYAYAAEVYMKNLSTTTRPFYISTPRFFLIHLADPHLMCIPSLHVMVVIHTYTKFGEIAKQLGEDKKLNEQILEVKQGALAISQAILFVKQHSVNCIPAALYAMTCFSPALFTPQDAAFFTEQLFSPAPGRDKMPKGCYVHPAASPSTKINEADQRQIKSHIMSLYNRFLSEKKNAKSWDEPIVNFLQEMK